MNTFCLFSGATDTAEMLDYSGLSSWNNVCHYHGDVYGDGKNVALVHHLLNLLSKQKEGVSLNKLHVDNKSLLIALHLHVTDLQFKVQ